MSALQNDGIDEEILDAITRELAALHRRYFHREPVTAETKLLDGELLACVMGGVYTEVEKTMVELQRAPVVRDVRSAFQLANEHRLIEVVERLTGREVLVFSSTGHAGPDLEVELFFLAPEDG